MDWILFFWIVFKSVLFSTGGFGPLPSLHTELIAHGWATEKQFTEALAVGQITPGPSGLWVVSLCYLIAGVPGAIIASIALVVPPLLVLVVQRCHARIENHPATQGLLDGVVLVIVSFSLVILTGIFRSNGADLGTMSIAVISTILAMTRRLSTNVILISAALVGFIWG